MKKIIFILLFFISFFSYGQDNQPQKINQTNQNQPWIIVVPYKIKGQKYRDLIENEDTGFNLRTAISLVDKAFRKRNFNTKGYIEVLESIGQTGSFSTDKQEDEEDILIKNSGADILVKVDFKLQKGSDGCNKAKIILSARYTITGENLSPQNGDSQCINTTDIAKLTEKAIESIQEEFMNDLQNSFTKIIEEGMIAKVDFVLEPNSQVNFDMEVGNDGFLLSEVISDWMKKNAYKGVAIESGSSSALISYKEVKLPLKVNNQNYTIKDFGREIRLFLKTLNIQAIPSYLNGQFISIKIK
ncbi:DUF6175 family protein [uncultured Flavobacterium sp.]|uniref:DUF6175 family protein n=1 Tax=uncultured Flavobacterium sp. TaxID=165435 RepID=UPI00261EBE77|nr:DUF6175 family protein [uncultured Flavobacterium sp.]